MRSEPEHKWYLGGWIASETKTRPALSIDVPVPETSLDWQTANQIVWLLWCFLQRHQPYLDIETKLKAFPRSKRPAWPVSSDDEPYSKLLRESARSLSPRFAQFPWFVRWLHKRVTDDHPDTAPDSIKPFVAHVDFVPLDLHVTAPIDATWDVILKVITVRARSEWKRLQREHGVADKRNRMPVNLLLASIWLFMSDFLDWPTSKIAYAHQDILSLRAGETATWARRYRSDAEYARWVEHFARAHYSPPLSLDWVSAKAKHEYADHLVSKCLKEARKLLSVDFYEFKINGEP